MIGATDYRKVLMTVTTRLKGPSAIGLEQISAGRNPRDDRRVNNGGFSGVRRGGVGKGVRGSGGGEEGGEGIGEEDDGGS